MAEWVERSRGKLAWLREVDRGLAGFGAHSHTYALSAPVAPVVIEAFGDSLGVAVPADLADFWTELGGSGAGPGYGICHPRLAEPHRCAEPFPGVTELRRRAAIADGYQRREVIEAIEPYTEEHWDDTTIAALERAAARAGISVEPTTPVASHGYFELPRGEVSGLLSFAHQGCGHWSSIVTCGLQTGQVVEIGSGGGVSDVAPSFAAFYEDWLDSLVERLALMVELMSRSRTFEDLRLEYKGRYSTGESPETLIASIVEGGSSHQQVGSFTRIVFSSANTQLYEEMLDTWQRSTRRDLPPAPSTR